MKYDRAESAALKISSLQELLDHEGEIVRRIRAIPNGGQLLLLDPQRLLKEAGVEIAPAALQDCQAAQPELFASTGREHAYEAVARSRPEHEIRIRVKGLFRRRRA